MKAHAARSLGNGDVEVTLLAGEFRVEWGDVGIAAGPFRARAEVDGRAETTPEDGEWVVTPGEAAGRPGTWARFTPIGPGPSVAVHMPSRGPVVAVELAYEAPRAARLDRLVVLDGPIDLGAPLDGARRLVLGYDSWAYAGVRAATEPGHSAWGAAVTRGDGAAFAAQALTARRFVTDMATERDREGRLALRVTQGAAPPQGLVEGTIGYTDDPAPPLGLTIPRGAEERGEAIVLAAGPDAPALLTGLAERAARAMRARRADGPPLAGWESWYQYGLLEVTPERVLANALRMRERFGERFDLVQIDDGWQASYGAWWPNDRFPADLGELARGIRELGCRPGLWLAPFMVQPGVAGVGTDHPDWCLADPSTGAPLLTRDARWSLDGSHPDARAWLQELGAQVRAWGFDMVKLDFCWYATLPGRRDNPRATGVEALRAGLRAFLDGLGDEAYVLGCGMPLLPAVGIVHGNRIGHDLCVPVALQAFGHLASDWTAFTGIRAQGRNVAARFATHGRWYEHDPDVVMAWGSDGADPAGFPTEEARTLATLAALCGGPFLLADDLDALAPAERAVLEHPGLLGLLGGGGFVPVDLFEHVDASTPQAYAQPPDLASVWVAERDARRVTALFNWTDRDAVRFAPEDSLPATELWTGAAVTRRELEVPAHAVRVLVRE